MALQFQPPSFVRPMDYSSIPKSIDDLFTAYGQGQLRGQQIQQGQNQLQLGKQQLIAVQNQNALAPIQLAQAQLTQQQGKFNENVETGGYGYQALNESIPSVIGPQSQTLPPGMLPSPQQPFTQSQQQPDNYGANPGLGQPENIPLRGPAAFAQNMILNHLVSMGLSRDQAIANLQETQSKAAKAQSEASVNDMFTGAAIGKAGGLDQWAAQLRKDVSEGRISPEQAFSESSRLGPSGTGRLLVDKALSGLPLGDLQAKQRGKEALASGAAVPLANTETLQSSLNVLDELNKDAPRASIQTINKYGLAIAAEKGDRYANRLLQQSKVASDLFQNNFGQGSNEKLALAKELSDPKQTTNQMSDTISLMRADMKNRTSAFRGEKGTARPEFLNQNVDHSALLDKYGTP